MRGPLGERLWGLLRQAILKKGPGNPLSANTRNAFLSVLVLASCASTAGAQQAGAWIRGPGSSVLFIEHTPRPADGAVADTTARVVPPTQWKRGLVIGGVAGAVGFGAALFLLCEDLDESQDSCLGSGLGGAALGAVIGGTVGALIGGQFPQRVDPLPAPDSTEVTP
jgi:hypothetical protein